jgi:ribokinase
VGTDRTPAVAMIGNLNMDLIIRGVPSPPEWGREVIGSGYSLVPAGQAAYSAFALRALGVPVRLVAGVGQDAWGRQILAALSGAGVDCRGVEVLAGTLTGITVALVRPDGERGFVSDYGALHAYGGQMIRRHEALLLGAPVLAFCGLNTLPALPLEAVRELFRRARSSGARTVLDTGWDPYGWPDGRLEQLKGVLSEVSVFLPNREEAAAITGRDEPEAAAGALRDMGVELAVIKLGPEGSYALGGSVEASQPALPVKVLDAVGAGDVYAGGFIFGMLRRMPVRDCMALGSAAAGLYVSRAHDRFPVLADVLAAARSYGISIQEDEN